MRNTIALITAVALLAVTGCKSVDNALLVPKEVVTPPTTNAVTGAITPAVTNTVLVPKDGIENGLATGRQVAQVIPPPYGTVLDGILALGLAALGLYAQNRNKKKEAAETKLDTAVSIVKAITTGVEAIGHPETKAAIQNAAVAAGVQSELHPIVQQVTTEMK